MIETFFTPGSMAPAGTPGPGLAAFHTPQAELRPFPALAALNAATPPPATPTLGNRPASSSRAPASSGYSPLGQGLSLSAGGAPECKTPLLKGSGQASAQAAPQARTPVVARPATPHQAADSPSKLADAAEKVSRKVDTAPPCGVLTHLELSMSQQLAVAMPPQTRATGVSQACQGSQDMCLVDNCLMLLIQMREVGMQGLLKSHSWGVNPTPQNTPMAGVAASQGHGSRLAFNISIAECIPGLQVRVPEPESQTSSSLTSLLPQPMLLETAVMMCCVCG